MRKLKKFKRFEKGGLTDSSGNPVLSGDGTPIQTMEDTETPDEKYAKRRESYEGIKDFFMGRRSKDEPSAPIEERKPPKKAAEPAKAEPVKPAETKPVEIGRGRITSTSTMTEEESRADSDKGAAPSSSTTTGNAKKAEAYRQSLMPVNKPKPKPPAPAAEKTPAAPAKAPRAARPEDIPGTDVETPYKGEKIQNSGQFAQSAMAAFPALRGVGAGIRGAMGLGRMFESATKPTPKVEPKLESSAPTTPRGGDPRAAANRRAAESETKEAPKETPIRVDPRAAANRRAAEAKEAPKETPTRVDPRAAANRRAAESEGKQAPKETPKAKSPADDEVAQEAAKRAAASRPRVTPKRQEDSAKFGGGKGTPSKAKTKAEVKPTAKKFDKPVGEKEGPTVDKVLESKGLSAKKGGKIPAFKKGGLVSRGDGCAQRGKTKGRMM